MKTSPVTAVPATPAQQTAEADDTQEIREQIERTREDMGRTIDELQDRLSPQNVVQQAKDSVHDATVGRVKQMVSEAGETVRDTAADVAERAQDTATSVVDEARAHPVVAALIGAGVVWLLSSTSMFRGRSNEWDDDHYDWDDDNYGVRRRVVGAGGSGRHARYTNDPTSYRSANFQGEYDMRNGYGQGGWTDMLRDHPVPTALAAIGIGYLVMQRDSGGGSRDKWRAAGRVGSRRPGWAQDYPAGDGSRGFADTSSAASGARQAVGDMSETVGEWGEQLGDGVRRAGAQARESAGELTENVQERWQTVRRRTSSEFQDWMDENPLAVGAAALAAGLAIGFTTPRTDFEDEQMGAARDALVERTSDVAEDAAHQVSERVKSAASNLMGDEKTDQASQQGQSGSQSGGHSPVL